MPELVDAFKAVAEQGDMEAQFSLGFVYASSLGVAQDYKQAMFWYEKAAAQGHSKAQFQLGLKCEKGEGVKLDYNMAANWYAKAAEQRHAGAQLNLGVLYYEGKGVAQDYVEAHKRFTIAEINGNSNAISNRSVIEGNMTQEQIAEAQQRANAWITTHSRGKDA